MMHGSHTRTDVISAGSYGGTWIPKDPSNFISNVEIRHQRVRQIYKTRQSCLKKYCSVNVYATKNVKKRDGRRERERERRRKRERERVVVVDMQFSVMQYYITIQTNN